MSKKWLAGLMAAVMLLPGCSSQGTTSADSSSVASSLEQKTSSISSTASSSTASAAADSNGNLIDPPYDFNPEEMVPSDFGNYFTTAYDTEVSTYQLLPGDQYENEVTVLKGKEDGPTIYVVAGIHGDETAGWSTGDLLKKANIRAGTLYILSPANRWGASASPRTRFVTGTEDLNRNFPGSADGTASQRIANAIMKDIERTKPVFVFDLHEARVKADDKDFLGSSLIYSDLTPFGDLFLNLMMATQSGEICSEPFNFYSPGPDGSINKTVTSTFNLPVLTVETYRGYPLKRRIGDQLDIVQYVLSYYGLI